MRKPIWILLGCIGIVAPAAAQGQVAWDSPFLTPPRAPSGFGLYLIDPAGGDLGVMAAWRSPSLNFGIRGGIAEDNTPGDDLAFFGGVDFDGAITRATADFPLDVDWVAGIGLGIGDDALISVPVGLSLGHAFRGDGVVFTPYVTPRVVLDAFIGDGDGSDDVDLDLAFDLGLDLRFTRTFGVRFGATLGDREAVAIGVLLGPTRTSAARRARG